MRENPILNWNKFWNFDFWDKANKQIQVFPRIFLYLNDTEKQLLFLSGFSITDTDDSQVSRGRDGPSYFSMPFQHAHKYWDYYFVDMHLRCCKKPTKLLTWINNSFFETIRSYTPRFTRKHMDRAIFWDLEVVSTWNFHQ